METRTLRVPKSTPATMLIVTPVKTLLATVEHRYTQMRTGIYLYLCSSVFICGLLILLVYGDVPAQIVSGGLLHGARHGRHVGRHVMLEAVLADEAQQR